MSRNLICHGGTSTPIRDYFKKSFAIGKLPFWASLSFLIATAFLSPATQAQAVAQQALQAGAIASINPVAAVLTQRKVVKTPSGTEKLEDASTVKPGDIIEYRVTYTNNSTKAIADLKAHLPIPEGLEYIALSAKPGLSLVKAAAKDGVYGPEPLMHLVQEKPVPILYAEYRQLRWSLGVIQPGAVVAVSARARVETVVSILPIAKK